MAKTIGNLFLRNICNYVPRKLFAQSNLTKPWIRNSSSTNMLKVTLLGAANNLGKSVALMLKQSSLIDELCLYDTKNLDDFATDLSYIDTKSVVKSYFGVKDIKDALARSNIIVILATGPQSETYSYNTTFDRNIPVVKDLAIHIAKNCPKAFVAIATEPVNSMVPMFSEVMKKHGHYNPYAIFGITTVDVVRTNRFVAEILGLEPECVVVPVIGGHTEKTIVPVLSNARPCNELTNEELEDVTSSVRHANENLIRVRSDGGYLSTSFGISRFVLSLVKAIHGQADIIECAYVKSNVHPQLKYLATPLLLGPGGISRNMGIPDLTDFEACLLDSAIPILVEDIKKGEFAGGIIQEDQVCDPCENNPKGPRCPTYHCELQSLFGKEKN